MNKLHHSAIAAHPSLDVKLVLWRDWFRTAALAIYKTCSTALNSRGSLEGDAEEFNVATILRR
jgi:hypothetical protein